MKYWNQGDRLQKGRYIIEKILGTGGFAITYKAIKYLENDKTELVALKTLNPQIQNLSNTELFKFQESFVKEAFLLQGFQHPHIVKINNIFSEEEMWFIDMEYIKGPNLSEYTNNYNNLYNKGLPENEALIYIKQIGEALIYVHNQGFLHRDIKPQNIMLRKETKEAVLIDFGIAREFVQDKSSSHTNDITQGYAPIEQYERHSKRGAYTDVYALAATLYYLLTVVKVIPADYRKLGVSLQEPKKFNSQISDEVNHAILKGMELLPENRPQTMAEWLDLLPSITPHFRETDGNNQITDEETNLFIDSDTTPQDLSTDIQPPIIQDVNFESPTTKPPNIESVISEFSNIKLINSETPTIKVTTPFNLTSTSSQSYSGIFNFQTIKINTEGKIIKHKNRQTKYISYKLGDEVEIDFVCIPSGRLLMGTPQHEKYRKTNEGPQHWVDIPSFWMSKYPVTQAQWMVVMGNNPSLFQHLERPVETVSWNDATDFCNKLSDIIYQECHLPSESKWEYACRAGTTTPFNFGETILSNLSNYYINNYNGNKFQGIYRRETSDVGIFPPNDFGLYDMHGNVWEWCADNWHDNYETSPDDGRIWFNQDDINYIRNVLRGGSWTSQPWLCRSGSRYWMRRDFCYIDIGFRVIYIE